MGLLREMAQAFGLDSNDSSEIRGWTVDDETGTTVGRVQDLMYDPDHGEVRYAIVDMDGRQVLVPINSFDYDEAGRRVTVRGYSRERLMGLRTYDSANWSETSERETYRDFFPEGGTNDRLDYTNDRFRGELPKRIQLLEERLRVGKARTQVGEAVIGKKAVEEPVQQDITLQEEKLHITRHPVDRPVAGDERILAEGETISVPLYAEHAQIDKETFVREEVEIGKRTEERVETISDTVRREELDTTGEVEKRELAFSGTEPVVERDRLEGQRIERKRIEQEQIDLLPDEKRLE